MTTATTATAPLSLRKETVQFLETLRAYLSCRAEMDQLYEQIDPTHSLTQIELESKPGMPGKDGGFDATYQQQSISGKAVHTLQDLYQAAEQARPVYEQILQTLVKETAVGSSTAATLVFPEGLKGRGRAIEKIRDDYTRREPGPGASWLYDVVRASVLVSNPEQVQACVAWLQQHEKQTTTPTGPSLVLVKAKNRFASPTLTGYRDIILHFGVLVHEKFTHVCELQIHIEAMHQMSQDIKCHKYYEYFRSYFSGADESLSQRLHDLEAIAKGDHTIDSNWIVHFVENENEDVERLDRLAKLFSEKLAEHDGALQCYEKGLEIQKRKWGEESAEVATCLFNIALVQLRQGEHQKALEFHRQALAIRQSILDKNHQDMAKSYSGIARVLDDKGEHEESLKLFEKALSIVLNIFGEVHPDIAFIRGGMAVALKNLGKIQESLEMYQKTLDVQMQVFGPDHERTSITYSGMAKIYDRDGQYEKSLEMYQEALDIVVRALGKDHIYMAQSYNGIAAVMCKQKRYPEALEFSYKALEIRVNSLGENHPKVADAYGGIAKVLCDQGKLQEALENYNKALTIQIKKYPDGHRKVVDTLSSVSSIHEKQRQYKKAIQTLQKELKIRIKVFGEESLKVASTRVDMARVLKAQLDYDESIAMLQSAKEIYEKHYDAEDPQMMDLETEILEIQCSC